MKFLIFSHIFPPAIDGGSSHLYSIGDCLQKHGHQVIFLSSDSDSSDQFIAPRIFKLIHPILAKGPIFKIIPFLKILPKLKPDYIIAGPFPTTIPLYAVLLAKITKAKLILIPCFHPTDPLFSHSSLIKTLHQASLIFTLTNFEKKYLSSHFHLSPSKINIIPSGIPKILLKNTPAIFPKNPHLLYIGSFSAHKGISDLISSLPPNCTLTLAGQKTLYWPHIKTLLANKKNIKILFNFKNFKLPNLIDSCTCLVLPSYQESFGKVLLEAWARQKPVITRRIPAPTSLILASHGGLLFTHNLKKQISKLINNPKLCRRLGQNGYHFVKNNYTWDKIGESLCQKLSP